MAVPGNAAKLLRTHPRAKAHPEAGKAKGGSSSAGAIPRRAEELAQRERLVANALRLLERALAAGLVAVVENPRGSRLWRRRRLRRIQRRWGLIAVDHDMCPFGTCFRKPQRLLTNRAELARVSRFCECKVNCHEHLTGKAEVWIDGRWQWRWKD